MRRLDQTDLSNQVNLGMKERNLLPGLSIDKAKAKLELSPALILILAEVRKELGLVSASNQNEDLLSDSELEEIINRISARLGFELGSFEKDQVLAQIERESNPFGVLQPLVEDPSISDIIVSNYANISVQQGKLNVSTDISFSSPQAYEAFVEKILQRAGTTYSTKKPIADGMIGGFARVHAVHGCLCESGPYLTIRINRFSKITLEDLGKYGIAPDEILDYLRKLISAGKTILIVGEVGTGKTTLARALAAAVPREESILVIEDTPEIRLEHPHVRYLTTREVNSDGAGRITPQECIRAGMRMAMNRIIFGEMRDAEAAEAFIDVCASGHPGLSTIHARSAAEAVSRLELFLGRAQRGASKSVFTEQIATAVQVIVFVDVCRLTRRRRIIEVREVGPVADGVLRHREMFKYRNEHGIPQWRVVTKSSAHKEELEEGETPTFLSKMGGVLELAPDALLNQIAVDAY